MKQYIFKYALILLVACFGMQQAGAKVWYATSSTVNWKGKAAADVKGLSAAIAAASDGDEIWVGGGEVVASVSISLNKSLLIYGGFAGTETKLEEREMVKGGKPWEFKNPTIIKAKSGVNIVLLNQTASFKKKVILDGLTISGGKQGINFNGSFTHTETYVQNCIIKENGTTSSYVDGGGIAFKYAAVKLQNCLIEGNTGKNGGGVYCEKGKVEDCMIIDNYAHNGSVVPPTGATGGWGGGIFNNAGVVSNCIIKNNKAKSAGGGFMVRVPASEFYNCLVVGNTAPYGGGVSFDGRSTNTKGAKIYNCIIADNISTTSGGGIYFTNDGQAAINCIFWGNKKNDDLLSMEITSGKKGCEINNSVIQKNSGEITGTDNIMLENRSDVFDAEGSYLQAKNFVGIDKGVAVATIPATDLAGNARIFGRGIDIGAYEYTVAVKPDGDVFYVDQDATGTMNGSSWENAFVDLGAAISSAKKYNTDNNKKTKIWVAAGTYHLDGPISLQEGVSIYGGFNGTEKSESEREIGLSEKNWDLAKPTILDGGGKTGIMVQAADYSTQTIIDGFTFQNANSDAGGAINLKKKSLVQNCRFLKCKATGSGGGLLFTTDCQVLNCYFSGCSAKNGGAVYVNSYVATGSITGCLVEDNEASACGGGIYGQGSVSITNCVVKNNVAKSTSAGEGGGGIFARVQINIIGCLITGNSAGYGGGIMTNYNNTSANTVNIVNNTIARNKATKEIGGYYALMPSNGQSVNDVTKTITIQNNIFWKNIDPIDNKPFAYYRDPSNSKKTVINCVLTNNAFEEISEFSNVEEQYYTLAYTDNITLKNVDSATVFGKGYALIKTSPCVDHGKNKTPISLPSEDVSGNIRMVNDIVDMGAYEYSSAVIAPSRNGIFYVMLPSSPDEETGGGSSWDNHLTSVVVAVGAAKTYKEKNPSKHVQIWIAGGTYTIPATLELSNDVSIYGGFAGTEKSLDERQKKANGQPWEFVNETILDGAGAIQLFNQKESFSTTTYVDGLTFQNAKGTGKGGAMYIQSNVMIQYCKFLNNTTSGNGGAINFVGSGTISKAVYSYFYGNSASNGGAIFTENSKADIENCWVEKNKAEKRGGGIYTYQGTVRNSYIYQNHSDGNEASLGGGGGLYGRDGGRFDNCIVIGNTSNRGAGIMAGLNPGYSFVTNIFNCVVADNRGSESGAGLHASPCKSEYGLKAYNTILWNNTLNSKPGARMELVQLFNCALQNGAGIDENVDQNCIAIATADKASAFDEEWKPVEGSPCIDAGTTSGITLMDTDYAGNKRISNYKVDIGAYEYQNPADAFEINYADETLIYISDPQQVIEYSADRENWVSVPYSSLIQKEESKGFCRLQSNPTQVYALDIPGRGEAIGSIDLTGETLKNFAENAEWNVTGEFISVGDGKLTDYITGSEKQLTIQQPATATAFKTEKVLVIPARPEAPAGWTLSYAEERLLGIEELDVLEATIDNKYVAMADSSIASYLTTDAAVMLKIRYKATETDFASFPWSIELAARPEAPLYTINYADSTTVEDVSEYVVYDTVETFANLLNGANEKLKLQPGNTYYFKWVASEEGHVFNSAVGTLEVPAVTNIAAIRVNFSAEKLEGLNEQVCWKVNGGNEEKALEDISGLVNLESEVTLTVYVPQGVNAFATPEYTFVLPKREAAPDWTINYSDEVIIETNDQLTPDNWEIKLPEATEYAKLDESGVLGSYIPTLEEGVRTLMLRTAAGVDAFHSEACEVVLSPRPQATNVAIDYATERTREVVPANVEYSVLDDMEAAVMGGDTTVVVEPGIDLYFRIKATESSFASAIQKLAVPERPAISEVTIDFENRTLMDLPLATVCQVGEGAIATAKEDLTDIIPAVGQPATTLKIWVPEQEGSFKSEVIELNLPAYPADPQLDIDYNKEALEGISGHMMWKYDDTTYAASADISGLIPAYGENERTLTVWVPASDTSFRSLGETEIVLPARKENLNAFSIDYLAETTQEMVADDIAYSYDPENEEWNIGDNAVAQLRPGVDIWFKRQANAANKQFASAVTKLEVPARPVITAEDMEIYLSDGEYIPEVRNSWTNTAEGLQMTISDPEVAVLNGTHIVPKKSGECQLTLALAAVVGEHFAAETKTVALKVISDGSTDGELAISNLKIAGRSDMVFRVPGLEGVSGVRLIMYNQWGKVIFEAKEYGHDFDMGNLDAGTYYYVLTYPKDGQQQKKKGFVEIVR